MEARRRLILLAVIIVAVAIGSVGVTMMSLFDAGIDAQRLLLMTRVSRDTPPDAGSDRALLQLVDGKWVAVDNDYVVPARIPAADIDAQLHAMSVGTITWRVDDRGTYLLALRRIDESRAGVAWAFLDVLRAPYHRAALEAMAGLLILVVIGVFIFYRTTTPLLRRVEESELRYRTLFSNTAEGVLLFGDRIEECNPRACELFGMRREDVVGQSWRDLFRRLNPDTPAMAVLEGRVVEAADGHDTLFPWEMKSPSGGPNRVVEIALRRLVEGGDVRVLASLRDVSFREEAARALKQAEYALRESRERLAQAGQSSALVELVAGIAHEVNQPLAAISNYAQASRRLLVPGQPCPEDVSMVLDRIAEQAQRAGDAIHRIRALVAESPRRGTRQACVNGLVTEVEALMRPDIEKGGAKISLSLQQEMKPVQADPLQIQQVILQLLRNALDAVAHEPPERRCITVRTGVAGNAVEVTVCDSGPGVSLEDQARLFEPFFSTRKEGMGLGLALSLSIIRSHMGEMEYVPAAGGGACFRFRLPVASNVQGSDATCPDKAET